MNEIFHIPLEKDKKLTKLTLNSNIYISPRRSFQGIKVKNISNIQKSLTFSNNWF